VVWAADAIDRIEDGSERSLSAGYRYQVVMDRGTFQGTPYDGRMTEIIFNHVALVSEPRVPGAMVGDSMPKSITKTRRNLIVMDSTEPGYNHDVGKDEGPDIDAIKAFAKDKLSPADFMKFCEMLGAPDATQAMDAASRQRRSRDSTEAFGRLKERFPDVARLRILG
jgi:hypothetical protein